MLDHQTLSTRQLQEVHEDVAEFADRAQALAKQMLAAHGPEDPRTVRAQEVGNAIQRLQWAMERQSTTVGA